MAEAYILRNGKIVKGTDLTNVKFFTTGHIAGFTAIDGEEYTCVDLLETSLSSISYVQEKSFYQNIEGENYERMLLYNDWKDAKEGDTIKVVRREIDANFNYCWYDYYKSFVNSDHFNGEEINLTGFIKDNNGRCNLNILSPVALNFFDNNIVANMQFARKIGDIAQLINNIDKYIYHAFTSPLEIDSLKSQQTYT